MKKLIVMLGSVLLGIIIFGFILGDDNDSIKSNSKKVMESLIEQQKTTP